MQSAPLAGAAPLGLRGLVAVLGAAGIAASALRGSPLGLALALCLLAWAVGALEITGLRAEGFGGPAAAPAAPSAAPAAPAAALTAPPADAPPEHPGAFTMSDLSAEYRGWGYPAHPAGAPPRRGAPYRLSRLSGPAPAGREAVAALDADTALAAQGLVRGGAARRSTAAIAAGGYSRASGYLREELDACEQRDWWGRGEA